MDSISLKRDVRSHERPVVVIVDADLHELGRARDLLRRKFDSQQARVESYASPQAVHRRALDRRLDVVVAWHRPPMVDAVTLLAQMRASQPLGIRLLVCADGDAQILVDAINRAEVWRALLAPRDADLLAAQVQAALIEAALRLEERRLADLTRAREGILSATELELRRLECQEPGITRVEWGANGEVLMPGDLQTRPIPL